MKTVSVFFLVFAGLTLVSWEASATQVESCENAGNAETKSTDGADISSRISISGCTKPPCRLRRKTSVNAEFKFTANEDIKTLKNEVFARIVGVPFPFLGVDNTNACGNIYLADGETKASCPLEKGKEYIYKNKINVLEIYPKLRLTVHWALVTQNNKRPVCFNVPAKITS